MIWHFVFKDLCQSEIKPPLSYFKKMLEIFSNFLTFSQYLNFKEQNMRDYPRLCGSTLKRKSRL